ncbi:MAG: membrane protein insertion efficiency factor YidD [Acidiferrobacterales bacterium]
MQKILIFLIRVYRYAISPLLGDQCRFYPSCSSYTLEALQIHGALKGTWLAIRRVLRCNPWRTGGIDQVPPCPTIHPKGHPRHHG